MASQSSLLKVPIFILNRTPALHIKPPWDFVLGIRAAVLRVERFFFGGHFENWRAPRGFYKVIPTRHGSGNETVSFKSFNVENNCSCQYLNFTGKMEDKILI